MGLMLEENSMKSRVLARYGSIKNFARAIGWSDRKSYYIVSGRQRRFSPEEMNQIAAALGISDPTEKAEFFLRD